MKTEILDLLSPALNRVEIVKSEDLFPGYAFTNENSHSIVTYIGRKKLVVNHCTSRYDLMRNEDVLLPLAENLSKHFDFNVKLRHDNFKRFFIDFTQVMDRPVKKDDLLLNVRYTSSYDSFIKWNVQGGIYRVWCSNGAKMPVEGMNFNVNIKHVKGAAGNSALNLDEIFKMVNEYCLNFKEVYKVQKSWENVLLTSVKRDTKKAFEAIIKGTNFPIRKIEDAINIASKEAKELNNGHISIWLAYHALNNVLNHDTTFKMEEHIRRDVDEKLVSRVNSLVTV